MISKCPKCEKSTFEVVEHTPNKSTHKMVFVQCALCGTVISTNDFYSIGDGVVKLSKSVMELQNKIDNIDRRIQQILNKIS